jgi:hypothetical protein
MKRPTKAPHSGFVKNNKTFKEAYESVSQSPDMIYSTHAGTNFKAIAKTTSRGRHKGKKVVIFKQDDTEMARTYECCWGKEINCNRTYIDSYTPRL